MNCSCCNNDGFVPSSEWVEWKRKFEEAHVASDSMAAALLAAGAQPTCPEERLCPVCYGAAVPVPLDLLQTLRLLKGYDVKNPEASVTVSQDFQGRIQVVAQVWDGRDWIRASTLSEAVRLVREAKTGDHKQHLLEADAAVRQVELGVTWTRERRVTG